MSRLGVHSTPAALEMLGFSRARVARLIGVSEEALAAAIECGRPELSASAKRRLRALLWRYGMVMVDLPVVEAAVHLPMVPAFKAFRWFAERAPDSRGMGLIWTASALAWRIWLRLTGREFRIRPHRSRFTNAVRLAAAASTVPPIAEDR